MLVMGLRWKVCDVFACNFFHLHVLLLYVCVQVHVCVCERVYMLTILNMYTLVGVFLHVRVGWFF